MLNGRDYRPHPLEKRSEVERTIGEGPHGPIAAVSHLRRWRETARQNGLEGIVSKRRMSLYVEGTASGWIKVKTAEWRAANRERRKLFEKT